MRLIKSEDTPKDWNSNTISYYVEKHKGGAPLRPADFSGVGFPVIPKKAIQAGNQLIIKNPTYCTDEFAQSNERSVVDCSFTITTLRDLVPTGPTIGTVVNYYTDEKYILSQGVYGLKLKSSIDRDYFAYMSNTSFYRNVMRRVMVGSTQVHIRTPEYLNLEIQTPPLPEQRKIANILSTWDKAIRTTERLIDNSKQQKKALMQQLLTGAHTQRKRLLNDTGKPFDGEWDEVAVGDLGTIYSGGTPSTSNKEYWDGDIDWITPTDITKQNSVYIRSSVRRISAEGLKNSSAKLVPKGSLLVCTRATIGEMAITAHEMCTNQGFKNIIPNQKTNIEFLFYLLTYEKHKLVSKASGSTFLELSKSAFESMKFNVPLIGEQEKIAAVLTNADNEIVVLEKQLADLKQEKKALMQQLLTGKRRVIV
jgi:type I restriction enzyme S subunit